MKRWLWMFVFGVMLNAGAVADVQAAPTPRKKIGSKGTGFGLGASLGDPMGLSMKYFFHPNHALQWHVAWLPLHDSDGGVEMSYLWHPGYFVSNSVMDFLPYLGIGFGIGFDAHNVGLIVMPPLGLAFHWKEVPLDTVIEGTWSPYVIRGPPTHVFLAAGDISVKVRYYF